MEAIYIMPLTLLDFFSQTFLRKLCGNDLISRIIFHTPNFYKATPSENHVVSCMDKVYSLFTYVRGNLERLLTCNCFVGLVVDVLLLGQFVQSYSL